MHILDNGSGTGDVLLPAAGNILIARYHRSNDTSYYGYDAALAEIDPLVTLPITNHIIGTSRIISEEAYGTTKMLGEHTTH